MRIKQIFFSVFGLGLLILVGGLFVRQARADEVYQPSVELRQEHRERMRLDWEDRFSQAVEDGVITDSQLDGLIRKKEELMANRTRMREEMQAWMEESGIDLEALRDYGCGAQMGSRGCGGLNCGMKAE